MGVRKVGVVGAGAMGTGIANVAAMNGYEVVLRDIDMSYVEKSTRQHGQVHGALGGEGKNDRGPAPVCPESDQGNDLS